MRKLMIPAMALSLLLFIVDSQATPSGQMDINDEEGNDSISVQVDGIGTIKDDMTAARTIAINDGLRIAVEQAKGIMVKGETEVKDFAEIRDDIVSKAKGFVRTYKILNESRADNVYRVSLEVEVMLSDPKAAASPVKMDEQKYNASIPKLTKEARFLFAKTNQVEKSLRSRRGASYFTVDDLKSLYKRYIVMAQVLSSIEPPPGKKEKMGLVLEVVRTKMRATGIFWRVISGGQGQMFLRRGFELNHRGNQLLKRVREET